MKTAKQMIEQHGNNLQAIFHTTIGGNELSKKVRRLEVQAHRLTTAQCNGDISSGEFEKQSTRFLKKLDAILSFTAQGIPVFLNGDARGYALKIKDNWVRQSDAQIHTDWGGYGIIAPDFSE